MALLTIFFLLSIGLAILMLALSFSQVNQANAKNEFCNNADVKRPMRISYDGTKEHTYCSWKGGDSAARIVAYFFAIFIAVGVIIVVIGMKHKMGFMVLLVLSILEFIFLFYVFVANATTVNNATKSCKDIINLDKDRGITGEHCAMGPQTAIAVLNFLSIIWIGNVILLALARFKWKILE